MYSDIQDEIDQYQNKLNSILQELCPEAQNITLFDQLKIKITEEASEIEKLMN